MSSTTCFIGGPILHKSTVLLFLIPKKYSEQFLRMMHWNRKDIFCARKLAGDFDACQFLFSWCKWYNWTWNEKSFNLRHILQSCHFQIIACFAPSNNPCLLSDSNKFNSSYQNQNPYFKREYRIFHKLAWGHKNPEKKTQKNLMNK